MLRFSAKNKNNLFQLSPNKLTKNTSSVLVGKSILNLCRFHRPKSVTSPFTDFPPFLIKADTGDRLLNKVPESRHHQQAEPQGSRFCFRLQEQVQKCFSEGALFTHGISLVNMCLTAYIFIQASNITCADVPQFAFYILDSPQYINLRSSH